MRWFCTQEQCLGWEETQIINNGRMLLHSTHTSSDEHRILKALLLKSLGRKKFLNNNFCNTRSLPRAHHYFESIQLCGCLDLKKKSPSGNYHVGDEVIESCVHVISSHCSATAWSICCHCIGPFSIVLVNTDIQENNNN